MEGQSKGSRGLEAYYKGGQGPPRAVAPSKKKKKKKAPLHEFLRVARFADSFLLLTKCSLLT